MSDTVDKADAWDVASKSWTNGFEAGRRQARSEALEKERDNLRTARREALEEAAKVAGKGGCTASGCDVYQPSFGDEDEREPWHSNLCPVGIAAAIRALKER
jgi:hypothetical protein